MTDAISLVNLLLALIARPQNGHGPPVLPRTAADAAMRSATDADGGG